jgi:acetyl/propionyl-CoA carboxylase alpha subunit
MEIARRLSQLTRLAFDDTALEITSSGNEYTVSLDGRQHRAERIESSGNRLELLIDGRRVVAYVSPDGQRRWVTVGGRTFLLTKAATSRRSAAGHDGSSELRAPMPGQVRAIHVHPGETVTKGQVLAILEAMKMEIRLQAPFDGMVSSVDTEVGQTVEREQILIRLRKG